jgi:hypothetical protein
MNNNFTLTYVLYVIQRNPETLSTTGRTQIKTLRACSGRCEKRRKRLKGLFSYSKVNVNLRYVMHVNHYFLFYNNIINT